jgi:hypothetical protein
MTRIRDPKTGRFQSLKQRTHARMIVENAARMAGARPVEWRGGKIVVRAQARTAP